MQKEASNHCLQNYWCEYELNTQIIDFIFSFCPSVCCFVCLSVSHSIVQTIDANDSFIHDNSHVPLTNFVVIQEGMALILSWRHNTVWYNLSHLQKQLLTGKYLLINFLLVWKHCTRMKIADLQKSTRLAVSIFEPYNYSGY